MDNTAKQGLLNEFETMKLIEQDARDFYLKASRDPSVTDQKVRNCLGMIAEDEGHHMELVERIMTIVKNCL
jgi:rubrerythrin